LSRRSRDIAYDVVKSDAGSGQSASGLSATSYQKDPRQIAARVSLIDRSSGMPENISQAIWKYRAEHEFCVYSLSVRPHGSKSWCGFAAQNFRTVWAKNRHPRSEV
jgi:hypothetical protein